jgi:DNA-binding MarR family transcriptional regulator
MTRLAKEDRLATAVARLKRELALHRDFVDAGETVFLSVAWTWYRIEKVGRQFFASLGITDAQFNALMILWDYRDKGLRQHELAALLVVNRASLGGVVDRLEDKGWVRRESDPADRRALFVRLTERGIAKLKEVRGPYYRLLAAAFGNADQNASADLILFNDELRKRLAALPSPRLDPAKVRARKARGTG